MNKPIDIFAFVVLAIFAYFVLGAVGPREVCVTVAEETETGDNFPFTYDYVGTYAGYDHLVLYIEWTDANTSVTDFDINCTVSDDGNVTDFTPQVCDDTADGTCSLTDAGSWDKASPGTANWPINLNMFGYKDFACAFSVGSGSTAAADSLTVHGKLCTK